MNDVSRGSGIRRDLRVTAAFVFVASGIAVLLALLDYPVIGHDAYVHLNWLCQFPTMFADGVLYPRWLPGSFGGFGAPTFYFYAPLIYWLAGVVRLTGLGSPQLLYQVIELFFSFLSVFTSYILIRQNGAAKWPALLGALVYSFLAYNFCDVFIRDALTEHAALAFLPLLFIRLPDRLRAIVIYAIGWTGLFLTNLPLSYLAVVSMALVVLARHSSKDAISQLIASLLAIAVSAIYLFPAFALRGLVHQRHLFDLPMHTSQFGFALLDIFQGHFDWLRILSVATFIAALLILSLLFKEGNGRWFREWRWIILLAIFFQLPFISVSLWHLFPGMPFVQFSWRWDGILLLAIVIVATVRDGKETPSRISTGNCVLIGLAIVTIVCELTISRNLIDRPPRPYNSYLMDAPEYATTWAASDPSEVIGITLRRINDPPAVLLGLTRPADSVVLRSKSPTHWEFAAHLARATPVRFHQFYWPYWKCFAGDSELTMHPDPNGFATAVLPAGISSITLRLIQSPIEKIGGVVSVIGLSLLFALILFTAYRWITTGRETTVPPELTRKM